MKYKAVMFSLAASFTAALHAENSFWLSSGLSYINQQNLQSTQLTGASGTATNARTGLQLEGGWQWQRFETRDGYSVSGNVSLNRGLDGSGDIRSLALGGDWMRAISPDWLARIGLRISDYRDDNQPAYDSRTGGIDLSLGWFGEQNAGLDLTGTWQQEEYDDDPVAPYRATRVSFGGRYHFPHRHDTPRWSMGAEISRFEADRSGYSYDAYLFTAGYSGWHWWRLEGDARLLWRNNRYENVVATSGRMSSPNRMSMAGPHSAPYSTMSGNGQNESQRDDYLTATLDLRYPLDEGWRLEGSLGAGQYRSNLADDRPFMSLYLGAAFEY